MIREVSPGVVKHRKAAKLRLNKSRIRGKERKIKLLQEPKQPIN